MGIIDKYPETVTFRLSEQQKADLFDLVEHHDTSLSTFCRRLVIEALKKGKRYVNSNKAG